MPRVIICHIFGIDDAALGAILGGAGQFAGGLTSLFGGGSNQSAVSQQISNQQLQFQRAAAAQGIRWKVEDAKAAGIHPLYALGAPTFNPGPIPYIGDGGAGGAGSLADSFKNMGQGLGRAFAATSSPQERQATAFEVARQAQQYEHGNLQNELLRAQINQINNRAQVGPGMPNNVVSSPVLGTFENDPTKVQTAVPGAAAQAAGHAAPTITWTRVGGGIQAFPTKQPGLDDFDVSNPLGIDWWLRNRVMPNFGMAERPTMAVVQHHFPGATGVEWDGRSQLWRPLYGGDVGSDERLRRLGDAATRAVHSVTRGTRQVPSQTWGRGGFR